MDFRTDPRVGQVGNGRLGDRDFRRPDGHGLMGVREKRVPVILNPAMPARRRHGDERGHVFIRATQTVAHPGTDAGTNEIGVSRVQPQERLAVSRTFRMQRADDAQFVGVPGEMRIVLAHPNTALSVLGKSEG